MTSNLTMFLRIFRLEWKIEDDTKKIGTGILYHGNSPLKRWKEMTSRECINAAKLWVDIITVFIRKELK